MDETVSMRESLIELGILEDSGSRLTPAFMEVLSPILLGHDPELGDFLEGIVDEAERRHCIFFYVATKYLDVFSLRDIQIVMCLLEMIYIDFRKRSGEFISK